MSAGTSKDYVRRVLSGALVVVLFPATAMSILLLIVARQGCSRWCAVGVLLVCWAILFAVFRTRGNRWRWYIPAILVVLGVIAMALSGSMSPRGGSCRSAGLNSHHVDVHPAHRWSPVTLVSEHDQLRMGSFLLPLMDPYMDSAQARAFRADFDAVYDDMNFSSDVFAVGSVMGDVYREVFTQRPGSEHYYIYVPAGEGPRPVLLFLHGWLGNFKAYVWAWRAFADATGTAIVCPSHGAGLWNRRHSEDRIRWAMDHCEKDPRLDANRVTLAGLSNGGMGVTRGALAMPQAFERLIFLSPVIEESIVASPAFAAAVADTPILIVSGAKDRRVPADYVNRSANAMKRKGLNVQTVMIPEQDHFLLLSDVETVASVIQSWQEGQ